MVLSVLVSLLGLALGAASTSQGSQNICAGFALADVSNVKLTGTTHYAANTLVNISNAYSSINVDNLPAFCRVELTITTNVTAGSFALTEVWLPDDWNGRVLTVGNGGLAGGGTLRAPSSFGSIPWSEGAGRIVLIYSCQTVTVTELGHVAMPQGCKCGHMSLPHGRQVRSGNELLTVPP